MGAAFHGSAARRRCRSARRNALRTGHGVEVRHVVGFVRCEEQEDRTLKRLGGGGRSTQGPKGSQVAKVQRSRLHVVQSQLLKDDCLRSCQKAAKRKEGTRSELVAGGSGVHVHVRLRWPVMICLVRVRGCWPVRHIPANLSVLPASSTLP